MIDKKVHFHNLCVVIFFIATMLSPVIIQGIQSMDGNFAMTTVLEEEIKRDTNIVDINFSKAKSIISSSIIHNNFSYLLRNSIHSSEIQVPPPEQLIFS